MAQCGGRARFFGDLDAGIESFEAPWVVDVTEGNPSYEKMQATRITLGESLPAYDESEVHHPPSTGNDPSFVYILRDRKWQGLTSHITRASPFDSISKPSSQGLRQRSPSFFHRKTKEKCSRMPL